MDLFQSYQVIGESSQDYNKMKKAKKERKKEWKDNFYELL